MPTYTELGRESWWGLEFQPPTLAKLCADLRAFYGVDAMHIGSKGDNKHLRGYHRSRAWIKNSRYCTNRSYSVTETAGNRGGGNDNWLAAVDFQPKTSAELIAACKRLDEAVRTGRLEKITEWYGNTDGDQRVDGYNNIANRVASSDSSHLWHLHLSFDRGRVGEDHSDLYAVLTGTASTEEDDDMYVLVRSSKPDQQAVYLANGITRRGVASMQQLEGIIWNSRNGRLPKLYNDGEVLFVDDLDAFGLDITPKGAPGIDLDEKALAAELAKLLPKPLTRDETVQAAFEGAQRAEKE